MQRAEGADGEPVAQHASQRAIAAVFRRAQSVAVLDAGTPAAEASRPRTELEVDAGVSQTRAGPNVSKAPP